MLEGVKLLSEFLMDHKLDKTLQSLRYQLLSQIPQKPTDQFMKAVQNNNPNIQQKSMVGKIKKNKQNNNYYAQQSSQQVMESLMSRMAQNSNIVNDTKLNKKIQNLMDNKIFTKLLKNTEVFQEQNSRSNPSSFPEFKNQSIASFQDELDLVVPSTINYDKDFKKQSSHKSKQASFIEPKNDQDSSEIIASPIYILQQLNKKKNGSQSDEYQNDLDLGYQIYVFRKNFKSGCKQLALQIDYPEKSVKRGKNPGYSQKVKKLNSFKKLPSNIKIPQSYSSDFPKTYNGITYNSMSLKIIYNRQKTGYEQTKDYPIILNQTIGGRFQVIEVLGAGVFAKVLKVYDLEQKNFSCLKLISNSKEYFDQSLDEIRILKYIKANCDPDKQYLLNYQSSFYHKEHLFIQTQLLKQNLLTAYKKNTNYFTVGKIQILAKQLLIGIGQLHKIHIIHCDLKPENILIKTYQPFECKIVDLGNSSFFHDQMGNYIQSRSYRAPEVILGLPVTSKIDIWSIGCILAQVWTTNILFSSHHIQGMLARIQSILGPWPEWMLQQGSTVQYYFTPQNFIFYQNEQKQKQVLFPKRTTLMHRLRTQDKYFYDFIKFLLEVDPVLRPSADQALKHPFLNEAKYADGL